MSCKVEIRKNGANKEVYISGYVNAVERDSRILPPKMTSSPEVRGSFVERVSAGVFDRAIKKAHNIDVRFNHEYTIGSTSDRRLTLKEDEIGLFAEVVTDDEKVVASAEHRRLRGWSFGFVNPMERWERGKYYDRRYLDDFELTEVSILDIEPAYYGTNIVNVEMRSESGNKIELRFFDDETERNRAINEIRRKKIELLGTGYVDKSGNGGIIEARYNSYHDPENGRFTSSDMNSWGSGAALVVEKGEKGKGTYVINSKLPNGGTALNSASTVKPQMSSKVGKSLANSNIEYNEVQNLSKPLSEQEIIDKIGGGDMTKGSCSSLAFAYMANKNGMDVTDYRGGGSRKFFSKDNNINEIAQLSGVKSSTFTDKSEANSVYKALGSMEAGKEYYLSSGRHAAIVRKKENGFEYLELQSPVQNGWKPFTKRTAKERFDCTKTPTKIFNYGLKTPVNGFVVENGKTYLAKKTLLIDSSSVGTKEYQRIMGYINTAANQQKKGESGGIK